MKQTTIQNISMTACAVIALVSLGVMAIFVNVTQRSVNDAKEAARNAQEAVDLVVVQRTEARETLCLKDQRFAQAHNAYVIGDSARTNDLIGAIASGGGTRKIDARTQRLVDAEQAVTNENRDKNLVPVPDCTPRGIADFYAGRSAEQQPDGAVGGNSLSTTTTTRAATRRSTTTTRSTPTTGSTTTTTYYSAPDTTDPGCLLPDLTIPREIPCPL